MLRCARIPRCKHTLLTLLVHSYQQTIRGCTRACVCDGTTDLMINSIVCFQNPFGAAKPREAVLAEKTGKTESEILQEEVNKEKLKVQLLIAALYPSYICWAAVIVCRVPRVRPHIDLLCPQRSSYGHADISAEQGLFRQSDVPPISMRDEEQQLKTFFVNSDTHCSRPVAVAPGRSQ